MAINEQGRQLKVAREAEEQLRTLAHSTRDVPHPIDSYSMLGELTASADHMEQVCRQLAAWHERVVDGTHYDGEDERPDGASRTVMTAAELHRAAAAFDAASTALREAHAANGVVRWYDDPQED